MEKKLEDGLYYVSKRIENTEKTLQFDVELSQVKNDQNKLHAKITRFEKLMWNELEGMQNEYRSGEGFFFKLTCICAFAFVLYSHTTLSFSRLPNHKQENQVVQFINLSVIKGKNQLSAEITNYSVR